jgi:hypothetical protein
MREEETFRRGHDEPVRAPSVHLAKYTLNVLPTPRLKGHHADTHHTGGTLNITHEGARGRIRRIHQDSDAGKPGKDLPEQFEVLAAEFHGKTGRPGDVIARAGEALDEPKPDRIVHVAMTIGIVEVTRLTTVTVWALGATMRSTVELPGPSQGQAGDRSSLLQTAPR